MAWTATLTSKTRDAQGRIVAVVTLTDGQTTDVQTYTTDTAPADNKWLIRLAKDRAAQLDANKAYVDNLPAVGAAVDFNVSTGPTAAEIAERAWAADYRLLRQSEIFVEQGLLANDNPQLVALRTRVANNVLPAYVVYAMR